VTLVVNASALSGSTEWLARARACPDGSVVGPTSQPERVSPAADACEKVALRVSVEVAWSDILDTPFVNVAGGD